jgi:hypothetical protein
MIYIRNIVFLQLTRVLYDLKAKHFLYGRVLNNKYMYSSIDFIFLYMYNIVDFIFF